MRSIRLLVVLIALVIVAGPVVAQDPLIVNAKTIQLKLENDRVRVLEARLPPGAKEQMHSHPPYIIYVISGGKALGHSQDGKTAEMVLETGAVLYRDAVTHWAENVGTTELHLILVELKSSK